MVKICCINFSDNGKRTNCFLSPKEHFVDLLSNALQLNWIFLLEKHFPNIFLQRKLTPHATNSPCSQFYSRTHMTPACPKSCLVFGQPLQLVASIASSHHFHVWSALTDNYSALGDECWTVLKKPCNWLMSRKGKASWSHFQCLINLGVGDFPPVLGTRRGYLTRSSASLSHSRPYNDKRMPGCFYTSFWQKQALIDWSSAAPDSNITDLHENHQFLKHIAYTIIIQICTWPGTLPSLKTLQDPYCLLPAYCNSAFVVELEFRIQSLIYE